MKLNIGANSAEPVHCGGTRYVDIRIFESTVDIPGLGERPTDDEAQATEDREEEGEQPSFSASPERDGAAVKGAIVDEPDTGGRVPARRGRPPGSQYDDGPLIKKMWELVHGKPPLKPWEAALEVAPDAQGSGTLPSRVHRLNEKYRERHPEDFDSEKKSTREKKST